MTILPESIVADIRAALAITEPDLDLSVGQPFRKVIDAIAEPIAEAYVDRHLLEYIHDIDTKSGDDLDDYTATFSIYRVAAMRASGTVVFERGAGEMKNVLIPFGTQLSTGGFRPVDVVTIVPAILEGGDTSIAVPAAALIGGSAGNIPSGSIVTLNSNLDGIAAWSNPVSFTGGADEESDDQLRTKFKRTVLRNLAGTKDMFVGVSHDKDGVTHANIIGAYKVFREQIEVSGGTGVSTLSDVKHVHDYVVFGPSIDDGDIMSEGVHYTFVPGDPPTITSVGAGVPDGIYDLEVRYVPHASRNDPDGGVENKIDIYVAGRQAEEATQQLLFTDSMVFNNTAGSPLNRSRFRRDNESLPVGGNLLIPLAFVPVLDVSIDDVIVINGNMYNEGEDYYLINDVSETGGTPRSLSGLEWKVAANGGTNVPATGTPFVLKYVFDRIPRDVEEMIESWHLLVTDVAVHQARFVRLNFHLAVILERGYILEAVESLVMQALGSYITGLGFSGVLQISDIIEVVHGVPGVDAVRFLNSADDAVNYAIQRVSNVGEVLSTYDDGNVPARVIDVFTSDADVPVLNDVRIIVRAQNSFGSA